MDDERKDENGDDVVQAAFCGRSRAEKKKNPNTEAKNEKVKKSISNSVDRTIFKIVPASERAPLAHSMHTAARPPSSNVKYNTT